MKQTTRIGTESQKWRSYGWMVISREGKGENGGTGTGNKKNKWQVQNRQGEVNNNIGNGEAKELICITLGHELRLGNAGGRDLQGRGERGEKNGTTIIA